MYAIAILQLLDSGRNANESHLRIHPPCTCAVREFVNLPHSESEITCWGNLGLTRQADRPASADSARPPSQHQPSVLPLSLSPREARVEALSLSVVSEMGREEIVS